MSLLSANEILQQLQKAQSEEQLNLLLQSIPSKCYEKCIDKPMRSLSSSEQKCVLSCADMYIEAWNVCEIGVRMSRHRAVRGNWQDEIADDGYDWEIKHVSKAVPGADVDWIVETLDYYDGDTEATIEYLQQEIGSTVNCKSDFTWENDVLIVECDATVLSASLPTMMVTTACQAPQSRSDKTEKKMDLMLLAKGAVGKRKFGDLLSKTANHKSMIKEDTASLLRNKMDDVVWSNNSSLAVGKPSAFAELVTSMEKDNIADKFRNQLKI